MSSVLTPNSPQSSPSPGVAVDPARRARLRADVTLAGRVLATSWPLSTFIAINPLAGLEDRPFGAAVDQMGELLGARGTLSEPQFRRLYAAGRIQDADLRAALHRRLPNRLDPGVMKLVIDDLVYGEATPTPEQTVRSPLAAAPKVAQAVDDHTATWCATYFDAGQAGWSMPGAGQGLYTAWRTLAPLDRSLPKAARRALRSLPTRADDALLKALDLLGVSPDGQRALLQAELLSLPGWGAHVRWRAEHGGDVDLVDYLALRLCCAAALLGGPLPTPLGGNRPAPRTSVASQVPPPASSRERAAAAVQRSGRPAATGDMLALSAQLDRLAVEGRMLVWQEAFERHYADALLQQLARPATPARTARPAAQIITCIDVRSEGLRRHLEDVGPYETLGFAGFFACAIAYTDLAEGASQALCPVLLAPRNAVREKAVDPLGAQADRRLSGLRALAGAEQSLHTAKDDPAAPFALAEATGWVAGPLAAAKTWAAGPYGALRSRLARLAAPPAETMVDVAAGFDHAERLGIAQVALQMMGLVAGFGRLVVLCAHGSTTENNPYGSSLDCGACGGSRGGPNARTAAALLNDEQVRAGLRAAGIDVPADTWFLAAEHDTATDRVQLLDAHLVPASHACDLQTLARDLHAAGERLASERCRELPGAAGSQEGGALRHVRSRSTDWAQVYPEWGLVGNAAFVIGPRTMTQGLDLGRRTFLHSYDAQVDNDGSLLETILTAPLVVAQWINSQYYFSSVDPDHFGAGNKTVHNVVGGIGVLAGFGGDLKQGLPWQSVGVGDQLRHEPMRLLAVVQAPLERVSDIIDRNPLLQRLFHGSWITLACRAEAADPWQRHTPHGWTSWTDRKDAPA